MGYMKIKKNHALFKVFNQKVKKDLEQHALLKVLVGQELCNTAEDIINNYFEHNFDKELNEKCFELVSDSVELSRQEEYRLEEDGKISYRAIAHYVLKELMYNGLIRYIQTRKAEVIDIPILNIAAAG
jgi:hypothetical protein